MYLGAVEDAFQGEIDYAQLVKNYANLPTGPETWCSPAECTGCEKHLISGNPESKRISTSYVERSHLSLRMDLRLYTRLRNPHSKKLENHCAALAIYFLHYNFAKIHSTIRCSPAMAAGDTSKLWKIEDIVALLPIVQEAELRFTTRSSWTCPGEILIRSRSRDHPQR